VREEQTPKIHQSEFIEIPQLQSDFCAYNHFSKQAMSAALMTSGLNLIYTNIWALLAINIKFGYAFLVGIPLNG
jgi:hypothetical protein